MKVMNSNDDEDINDDNFYTIVVFNFNVVVVLNFENEFKFCENIATNEISNNSNLIIRFKFLFSNFVQDIWKN